MNRKFKFDKAEMGSGLAAILVFCFTLLIAGPLFLYTTNIDELWFDVYNVIPVILVSSVIFIAVSSLAAVLLYKINKNLGRAFIFIIFIAALAFYVQGNFIGCDYGQLNGDEIEWFTYKKYAVESIAAWIGIPVIGLALLKWKGWTAVSKWFPAVAGLITVMQIVGLASVMIPENAFQVKDMRVITTNKINTYSSKKNVVMLVFDSLDAGLFDEALEKDPELKKDLEDFVYYPDTSGMYQNTKCSVPFILTGQAYCNEQPFNDYVVEAYRNTSLYNTLESEDFDVNIYGNKNYVSAEMEGRVSNLILEKKEPSSQTAFTSMLYRFVLFRYAPHQLKKYFWFYSGDFSKISKLGGEDGYTVYPDEDLRKTYTMMTDKEYTVIDDKNEFKYIHTRGVHRPYEVDAELQSLPDGEKGTIEDVTLGCIKYVKDYVAKLKEAGVYDNTALIITADHGYIYYHQNPFLLYKNYDHRGEFTTSDSPVAFEDFIEAFETLASSDADGSGTEDLFEKKPADRIRPFYFYEWNTEIKEWLPPIKVFEIHGKASDIDSLVETDINYKPNNEVSHGIYTFEGNDEIIFDDNDKCNSLIKVGVSSYIDNEMGVKKRWSNAPLSQFQINVPDGYKKNIHVSVEADTVDKSEQHIEISVNDHPIDTVLFKGGTFDFVIPSEYAEDNVLGIKFNYPDRDIEFGVRGVTLHFSKMKLEEAD